MARNGQAVSASLPCHWRTFTSIIENMTTLVNRCSDPHNLQQQSHRDLRVRLHILGQGMEIDIHVQVAPEQHLANLKYGTAFNASSPDPSRPPALLALSQPLFGGFR